MLVYASTAASSALMPSHGAADAWALRSQIRSNVGVMSHGMQYKGARWTDVCPKNSTFIGWIAREPGMSNMGTEPGPGWHLRKT